MFFEGILAKFIRKVLGCFSVEFVFNVFVTVFVFPGSENKESDLGLSRCKILVSSEHL